MSTETTIVWAKPWTWSKTVWANSVALLIGILEIVQQWTGVTAIPLPDWLPEVIALALPIANLVLRFVTTGPITMHLSPRAQPVETHEPKRGI